MKVSGYEYENGSFRYVQKDIPKCDLDDDPVLSDLHQAQCDLEDAQSRIDEVAEAREEALRSRPRNSRNFGEQSDLDRP